MGSSGLVPVAVSIVRSGGDFSEKGESVAPQSGIRSVHLAPQSGIRSVHLAPRQGGEVASRSAAGEGGLAAGIFVRQSVRPLVQLPVQLSTERLRSDRSDADPQRRARA